MTQCHGTASRFFVFVAATFVVGFLGGCSKPDATGTAAASGTPEILNVSNDPTRELWRDMNTAFIAHHEQEKGEKVAIKQSHGGSSSQARAVIDGLGADVVTLAMETDVDAIRKAGLIQEGWQDRLPHRSTPYYSTIVFVVRKGNPKGIKDWSDLGKSDVQVITPNPKTSGNGKLSFLGAWGAVVLRGGDDEEARKLVTAIYKQTPVLDTAARAATTTFAQKGIGDVHLTWENEAHLEIQEAGGSLDLIYPPISIKAEPPVAVVDKVVDRKGTRNLAQAYLEFSYSDAGQRLFAKHAYRPVNESIFKESSSKFPEIKLFAITEIAPSWEEANKRFFGEGGIFDQIYSGDAGAPALSGGK